MLLFAYLGDEPAKFQTDRMDGNKPISTAAILFLLLGCVSGIGIGYSSWWCRDQVSATSFTLIGVMNKCLTVLLNLLIWDQHAPPGGIVSLVLCLVGGAIYRQAPLRSEASTAGKVVAEAADDVWESNDSGRDDYHEEGEINDHDVETRPLVMQQPLSDGRIKQRK